METNFDFSKTYYKVMNETENHNDYQYHNGLNILNEKFDDDPEHSCVAGRLYFTDYEHLPKFFEYGIYIREVRIPENARVIKDGNDKWGADKIILGEKYHIIKDFDKWFKKEQYNYKKYSWALSQYLYEHFDKWFDKELYNYENSSPELAKYCIERFDDWFDQNRYNYYRGSEALSIYCSRHFDKWFVKEKYNYNASRFLVTFCLTHIEKWYDEKLIDYDKNYLRSLRNFLRSRNGL